MAVDVLMRAYDAQRTGCNAAETVLTAAAVKARGLVPKWRTKLAGDARGSEGVPLIVTGVTMADGSVHDLCLVATMRNMAYALDAQTGALLWKATLGLAVQGSAQIDGYGINDHWGVLSTGAVDKQRGLWFVCAWVSQDGSADPGKAAFYVVQLDLATGTQPKPMLALEGVTSDPGLGLPMQKFASAARKQRAALLLDGPWLTIAFGSISETASSGRGWVIEVDTFGWRVGAAWASAARGYGGGIWQAGAGPALDDKGRTVVITSNGTFDAVSDWGESVVLLLAGEDIQANTESYAVIDHWAGWTDDERTGLDASGDELNKPNPTNVRVYTQQTDAGWGDQDLGSGGPVVNLALEHVYACGKDGILYTVNVSDMGGTTPEQMSGNAYGQLAAPPLFFTYFPGYEGWDPAPPSMLDLNRWYGGVTHHLHGAPLLWPGQNRLYCHGENGVLRAWQAAEKSVAFLAEADDIASPDSQGAGMGGMPGGMVTMATDGQAGGIVVDAIPYGNANTTVTQGRLVVYDAMTLEKVWDGQDWAQTVIFNKFGTPVVANGTIYYATYDGQIVAYGLTPQ